MITSSPICLCLAREKAGRDIMQRSPRGSKPLNKNSTDEDEADDGQPRKTTSIFTKRFLVDVFFYGGLAGTLSLVCFIISLSTSSKGLHGYATEPCSGHSTYDPSQCREIFKARGVCFMVLNTILLVHGWNCRLEKGSTLFGSEAHPRHNWALVWAIVGGFFLTLLTSLIPGLNTRVFGQESFGWEWGLVAASVVVFLAGSEAYKAIKRRIKAKRRRVRHEEMSMVGDGGVVSI